MRLNPHYLHCGFFWAGHFILIFHIAATQAECDSASMLRRDAFWVLVVLANGLVLVGKCFAHLELFSRTL